MSTADTTVQPHVAARSSKGRNRSVMALLTEKERHQLEDIAQLEMRSLSTTARMLMLRGIEQYEADIAAATQK